jgi:hypothetical protein
MPKHGICTDISSREVGDFYPLLAKVGKVSTGAQSFLYVLEPSPIYSASMLSLPYERYKLVFASVLIGCAQLFSCSCSCREKRDRRILGRA